MPLQWLHSGGTGLAEPKIALTPRAGMPLETQVLGHTEVSVHQTKVSDLAPIKGMPIVGLRCEGATGTDLSDADWTVARLGPQDSARTAMPPICSGPGRR